MSTQVTQELGFSTYVFVERLGQNAAILHPFPEFNICLVARALEEAGLPISIMGEHAPERGEGIYFQEEPFPDEFLGILADALSVRGNLLTEKHWKNSTFGGKQSRSTCRYRR